MPPTRAPRAPERLGVRGALLALAAHGSAVQVSGTARLRAAGDVTLIAPGHITVLAGRERDETERYTRKSSSTLFSDKLTQTYDHTLDDVAQLSRIDSGGRLNSVSGGSTVLEGAQLSARQGGRIAAGGEVLVTVAQDVHGQTHRRESTQTTFLGMALGPISDILPDKLTQAKSSELHESFDKISTGSRVSVLEGDLILAPKAELTIEGSQLSAGGDVSLSGASVTITGVLDEHRSKHKIKETGDPYSGMVTRLGKGMGYKAKEEHERTQTTLNRGGIEAGGDIHIEAREGELTLEATRIRTEGELTLATPGQLNLAAMKTLDYARSHAESKDDAWQKVKGEGHHDERLEHTQLDYGQLRLVAQKARVDGQQSELEALSAQPGMGWFKELQQVQDVDWRKIDTTHERWAYEQEGMTEAAAVVVSVVVSVFTAGAASALVAEAATAAGATAGSTFAAATAATATSAAVSAGAGNIALTSALTAMASNASVQLINNKGDVGAALEATFSEEAMKGYMVAGITAGLTAGVIDKAFGGATDPLQGTTAGLDLSSLEGVGQFALHSGARGLTQAAVDAAINGGSFEEKLAGALTGQAFHVVSAVSFNQLGDWAQENGIESGSLEKIAVKALVGGLISQAATGEFAPGALAAGANEALVEQLARLSAGDPALLGTASQLVGAVAGAITGGDAQFSSNLAAYDTQYNFLMHDEAAARQRLRDEREACAGDAACRADKQIEIDRLDRLDDWRDKQVEQACMSPGSNACQSWAAAIHIAGQSYEGQSGNAVDKAERASVQQHAFMYQRAANNPFLHGVGTGLLKLTPPGLAVGLVGGIAATVEGLIENGAEQTLINTINAIEDLPSELKARLQSEDPSVRGEALVDVVGLGLGGTALTAQGVKLTINATQKAAIARELARAEEGAIAKARVEIGSRADDAQQYDHFRKPDGQWDWQKQAPNGGAVPGTREVTTVKTGETLDRYGYRNGEYLSSAGTPYEARSLPPGKMADPYEQYPVLKPFVVVKEQIAPAFDQRGLGFQMRAQIPEVQNGYATVDELIRFGYLKDPRK